MTEKEHDETVKALEQSPHATVVPVVPQVLVLAKKGLAVVKSSLGR